MSLEPFSVCSKHTSLFKGKVHSAPCQLARIIAGVLSVTINIFPTTPQLQEAVSSILDLWQCYGFLSRG